MSFFNWVSFKRQGGSIVENNTGTPLVGGGSLRTYCASNPEEITLQNTTYTNGITAGRIRSLIKVTSLATSGVESIGFGCMQNNAQIHGGLNAGYGIVIRAGNLFTSPQCAFLKWTAGFAGATVLASTSSFGTPPTLGNTFCFQAEWVSDFTAFGGTYLRASYVFGLNFSLMVPILTYKDTTAPIITTTTEGLIHTLLSTGGSANALWDQTTIYQAT